MRISQQKQQLHAELVWINQSRIAKPEKHGTQMITLMTKVLTRFELSAISAVNLRRTALYSSTCNVATALKVPQARTEHHNRTLTEHIWVVALIQLNRK